MLKKINRHAHAIVLSLILFVFLAPAPVHAVDVLKICNERPNAAVCRDRNPNPGNSPLFGANGIITQIVNIISILIGIAAVIMIIMAGMKFVTSGSNPQEVAAAREMIIYAIVGLVLAATAQVIVRFVLYRIFG